MGQRAPNISTFKATSAKIYCFYRDFSPLLDEFWTVLCNSGLVRTARMGALKRISEHLTFRRLRQPPRTCTVLYTFFTNNW